MTLLELKTIVDRTLENRQRGKDFEVVIVNNGKGYSGRCTTNVKGANGGIDWETGLFLIVPENELKEVMK